MFLAVFATFITGLINMVFASTAVSTTQTSAYDSAFHDRISEEVGELPLGLARLLTSEFLTSISATPITERATSQLGHVTDLQISDALRQLNISHHTLAWGVSEPADLLAFGFLLAFQQSILRLVPRELRKERFPGVRGAVASDICSSTNFVLASVYQDSPEFDEILPSFDYVDLPFLEKTLLSLPRQAKVEFGLGLGVYVIRTYLKSKFKPINAS
jgi:hypothetical protein